jgi:hypothetical protein
MAWAFAVLDISLYSQYFIASKETPMAAASKNSRTTSSTHKFICNSCGGEVKMKTIFENGKLRNFAECEKCKRVERRPRDFS